MFGRLALELIDNSGQGLALFDGQGLDQRLDLAARQRQHHDHIVEGDKLVNVGNRDPASGQFGQSDATPIHERKVSIGVDLGLRVLEDRIRHEISQRTLGKASHQGSFSDANLFPASPPAAGHDTA